MNVNTYRFHVTLDDKITVANAKLKKIVWLQGALFSGVKQSLRYFLQREITSTVLKLIIISRKKVL